jgi:hypothetical protein
MSAYRLNIRESKYDFDHYRSVIDVLIPLQDRDDSYDSSAKCDGTTSSYRRMGRGFNRSPRCLYSDQEFREVHAHPDGVFEFFEQYLNKSRPLKIQRWNLLRVREDGRALSSYSYADKMGNLLTSYEQIVKSMPTDAFDTIITVLTKEESFMGDVDGCRKCRFEDTGNEDDEEEYCTDAEIYRHNRHLGEHLCSSIPSYVICLLISFEPKPTAALQLYPITLQMITTYSLGTMIKQHHN